MTQARTLLLLVVGVVLGAALGAFVLGPGLRGDASDLDRAASDGTSAARDPLAADPAGSPGELRGAPVAQETYERVAKENESLREEKAELVAKIEGLEARIESLAPAPADPQAFRFGVPDRAPSFDQADWTAMSDHVQKLGDELRELPEIVARGEQPSQAKIAKIVEHNTPLAHFAVAFGGDTKDPTPNGAFTHPAVIANLIRASLMAAEMPLSPDQEIALKTLGDAWLAETQRMEDKIPADAPVMKRTVAEVDAKLRFLDSARNVLTDAQRQVVFPPETTGRLKLDLLSPVLVYVLAYPVEAEDRATMETRLLTSLLQQAGVEEPDVAEYAWVGRQWVDDIPDVTVPIAESSMDLTFPHVDAVQAKARAQVAAAERILAMGNLTEEQAASLRSVRMLMYPYVPLRP